MNTNKSAVKIAMARACMDCVAISQKSGLPAMTVRNVIQGRSVRPVTLGKVAAALGVDPAELLADAPGGTKRG